MTSIVLGIGIALIASFVQSLGLTIQRKSHVLNQNLPEDLQRVEHRRPYALSTPNDNLLLIVFS
jgi:magnesium transporter